MSFQISQYFQGSDDDKIAIEYVGRLTAQCKELEDGEFDKLQLYPLSLTGVAFSSCTNLFLNSVLTWEVMEKLFHERFYKPIPDISIADLSDIKKDDGDSL